MDVMFFAPGYPLIRTAATSPPVTITAPITATFTLPQDLPAGTVVTLTFTPPTPHEAKP
jgi:hypothetical protein